MTAIGARISAFPRVIGDTPDGDSRGSSIDHQRRAMMPARQHARAQRTRDDQGHDAHGHQICNGQAKSLIRTPAPPINNINVLLTSACAPL
jgi:hypothetical protein